MGFFGKVMASGETRPIGSTLYGTCATAAGTNQKEVVCSAITSDDDLETGMTIHVKFTYSNTATSATMKVGGASAKNLCNYGTTRVGANEQTSWKAGAVVSFTYDGTSWVMNDYIPDTRVQYVSASGSNDQYVALCPSAVSSTGGINAANFSSKFKANPSTGNFVATQFNGYTLNTACTKDIGSVASGNTGLVTGGDVYSAIQQASAGALVYGGTVNSNSDLGTDYTAGTYWIVGTGGGTIAGQTCEAGDMIIAHADYSGTVANDVDIVQTNIDTITTSDIDTIVAS